LDNLRHSVVASLDGTDDELYQYLPFLLQDLWEIGACPEEVNQLIRRNNLDQGSVKQVIDLGCGKGIISVNLAKEFGFRCYGIDAVPEFVEEAHGWAKKLGVSHLCRFEVGDIRLKIDECFGYDIAVLGALGPVLGGIERTLTKVRQCLRSNGFVILDDGYIPDASDFDHPACEKYSETMRQIHNSDLAVVDERVIQSAKMEESDSAIYENISKRVAQLVERLPEKHQLFEAYLTAQRDENHALEHEITCVTWLLQRTD
jgi:cyclopropane fatty-acyl-phospholipid synthase-like methyltransferase